MTAISFHSLVAYFGKRAPGLKVHIYRLPGRALFNQEKSKLMQTKGQLSKELKAAFSFAPSSILSLTI